MIKSNLPVILLKGLVLLPHQEVRLELNNDFSKKVVDISKLYHDNQVLVVSPINTLEEEPDTSDLPKIGVIGKLKSVIELPNKNIRVVIQGLYRVKVLSYLNYSNEIDVLESIITSLEDTKSDEITSTSLLRKLIMDLDKYISLNPFISNSIVSNIKGITELDKLTDIIANFLPLSYEKKLNLMLDASSISRAKYLIKEISIEMEIIKLEAELDTSLKKELDESQKKFILSEKIKIIQKELGVVDNKNIDISSFNERIKKSKIPSNILNRINKEIDRYRITNDASPEISVIRNYIDYLLNIPWDKETKDEKDLNKVKLSLDTTHYGLKEIKERIIEFLAVRNISNKVNTPIICLVGPPGTGKSTLANSIASSIGRRFSKISLGGLSDSHELIGHRKTYIGSSPGKIINALIKSENKNPVLLLDEIDKLTKNYNGDPASALLDILDPSQNNKFTDNYIEEEVDLSKVLFIVTANDITTIPLPLLDRLEIIEINGYTDKEKISICNSHLIKKNLIKNGLKEETMKFENSSIQKIITDYTKESGVRELDRLINKIIRKYITNSVLNNKKVKECTIKKNDIAKYLGVEIFNSKQNTILDSGVINALAYTPYGGTTLQIEVTSSLGDGKFKTSGCLGDIINESVSVSISYIKSHLKEYNIKEEFFKKNDLHIHFLEGSTPKDGPSAGSAITTSIISYLKDKVLDSNVSMTGEISLKGNILPVGGIKEKSLSAIRNNINKIYVSDKNKKDIEKLDDYILEQIEFKFVKKYDEIYKDLFS